MSKKKREDLESSGSFAQQYDPNAKEATRLFLYCRLCRRTFPVTFRPRPTKRLKCLCGHETAVAEFEATDLFDVEHVEVKRGIVQPGRRPRTPVPAVHRTVACTPSLRACGSVSRVARPVRLP